MGEACPAFIACLTANIMSLATHRESVSILVSALNEKSASQTPASPATLGAHVWITALVHCWLGCSYPPPLWPCKRIWRCHFCFYAIRCPTITTTSSPIVVVKHQSVWGLAELICDLWVSAIVRDANLLKKHHYHFFLKCLEGWRLNWTLCLNGIELVIWTIFSHWDHIYFFKCWIVNT